MLRRDVGHVGTLALLQGDDAAAWGLSSFKSDLHASETVWAQKHACTHVCSCFKRLSDFSAEGDAVGCADGLALARQRLNCSSCFLCCEAAVQEAVLAAGVLCDESQQYMLGRHLQAQYP